MAPSSTFDHVSKPDHRTLIRACRLGQADPPLWMKGEVKRHCIGCEVEVGREDRSCPACSMSLRKECPDCHYWVEMDASTCICCRHVFPLPLKEKAVIKLWHPEEKTEEIACSYNNYEH